MLAFAWVWGQMPQASTGTASAERLGASLCAGIGGKAGTAQVGQMQFAYRALRQVGWHSRSWRPSLLPQGRSAVFHGYFDNADEIAAELGVKVAEPALLYGLAVERWGDDADLRIIGEYCALLADRDREGLRLSRSPLRAPPLCYFHSEDLVAVSSVPRAIFAAGVERRLNEKHLADTNLLNFTDHESSWFEDVHRVPLGSTVVLNKGRPRELRRYYDLLAAPDVRLASDADYISRAGELLDEAVRVCVRGFETPGATLSGGLDSPQVAARALAALPSNKRLPTFTFHPESRFDGRVQRGMIADERPLVEAFAAMHPRLEPHFTANEGYEHDHRWGDFFHLMGGAPSGLCNMYVFHGLFAGAAKRGCDVLLLSEWGNYTFSDNGSWGYPEYLMRGKWRQLWRALKGVRHDDRGPIARLFRRSISAFLPASLWRLAKGLANPGRALPIDLVQPLTAQYRVKTGAEDRLKKAGLILDRFQPRSRRAAQRLLFRNGDAESAEVYQGFEQMYGVAQRDPMAYRPFVEFCLGLPTEMFLRHGVSRWLAKELAKDIMPDDQRDNYLNGRWDADWHLRIGRRRAEFIAELDALAEDPSMSERLDIPRLRSALDDWPEHTVTDPQEFYGPEMAVPRGLLAARFIRYMEGRNQ